MSMATMPIPEDRVEEYREMASEAGEIWMEHGALQYFECVGDDMDPEMGGAEMSVLTFPDMVDTGPGETVVFAFVIYESREHRDRVNEKVMEDPSMKPDEEMDMPFDVERMAYGGFKTIVELGSKE